MRQPLPPTATDTPGAFAPPRECAGTSTRTSSEGAASTGAQKYLPDGLSLAQEFARLTPDEKRLVSQIQGRTYANMFGLVERFITAKVLEVSRDHWLGDQTALEALVRFSDEELKHQELFRRIETMIGADMPAGYRFDVDPDAVAARRARQVHLGGARAHAAHRAFHPGPLPREHRARRRAVAAVQGRLPVPLEGGVAARHPRRAGVEARATRADAAGARRGGRRLDRAGRGASTASCRQQAGGRRELLRRDLRPGGRRRGGGGTSGRPFLKAYRWQYIFSGAGHPSFAKVLSSLTTAGQRQRIEAALATCR